MRTVKTLIRLGGCPGWSEFSLGAHAILLVLSWGGSGLIMHTPFSKDTAAVLSERKSADLSSLYVSLGFKKRQNLWYLEREFTVPFKSSVPCHDYQRKFLYFSMKITKICTIRVHEMSHNMTKPTKWMCALRKLRSAWASTQSDQSQRCALNG